MNKLPTRLPPWSLLFLAALLSNSTRAAADDAYTPFEGEKTPWHDGFDVTII